MGSSEADAEFLQGFEDARRIALGVVGFEACVQLLFSICVMASVIGIKGWIELRSGVDRRCHILIAIASFFFALTDWSSLAATMDPIIFFGGDCQTSPRIPALTAATACICTYAFLVLRARNFSYKTSASQRVFRLIYVMVVAMALCAIIGSACQVNYTAVVNGYVFCRSNAVLSQEIAIDASSLMGLFSWIAEIACLFLFITPLRQLIRDLKRTPDGQGYHLLEFQKVARHNTIASLLNIAGVLICTIAQVIIRATATRAATEVLGNILYSMYGLLSVGGMLFCMRSSFVIFQKQPSPANTVGRSEPASLQTTMRSMNTATTPVDILVSVNANVMESNNSPQ
eukprot:TRINITY_DN5716_c0_g1_i2.p1 TRINITY_DN5716_c0_g1~~TRINITY_DN5716_c0_g1_i2.p1  ORF type:complete len:343 (-),score=47.94 TRINITY_DN5716_c0_g1_i2:17-1045(-)